MDQITFKTVERSPRIITGVLLSPIIVAERREITVPSGVGGIITNKCTQYVSVTRFMVRESKTYIIHTINPDQIEAWNTV